MPTTVNTVDSASFTLGNSDDSSTSTIIPQIDSKRERITVSVDFIVPHSNEKHGIIRLCSTEYEF